MKNEKPKANEPAWKKAQQKVTTSKNNEDRDIEAKDKSNDLVKIKMKSDYRDVAKKGDVWETDGEKAEELVALDRAEYLK